MRKLTAFILILAFTFGLPGCNSQSNGEAETKEYQFHAVVIEVSEDYLLVEPEEGSKA